MKKIDAIRVIVYCKNVKKGKTFLLSQNEETNQEHPGQKGLPREVNKNESG